MRWLRAIEGMELTDRVMLGGIALAIAGGPLVVAMRGGPAALGGGGVAVGVGATSAPAFLLIQRLASGS